MADRNFNFRYRIRENPCIQGVRVFPADCSRLRTHAPRPFLAMGSENGGLPEDKMQTDARKMRVDLTADAHRPRADLRRG